MTIDYRKTLNDYKNRIMDDIRRQAVAKLKESSPKKKAMVTNKDTESSFVECLKGDHAREAYEKKLKARQENVKTVINFMSSNAVG